MNRRSDAYSRKAVRRVTDAAQMSPAAAKMFARDLQPDQQRLVLMHIFYMTPPSKRPKLKNLFATAEQRAAHRQSLAYWRERNKRIGAE